MRVISQKTLETFWEQYKDSEPPLREWFKTAQAAAWQNLMDVRRTYSHADAVETPGSGTLTVFNVCGNKYRLIVRIKYDWQLINVRAMLTHKQYDKDKWKE